MTSRCGCRPGSYENGWHEVRCAPCIEEEFEQFRSAMRQFRKWRSSDEFSSLRANGYTPWRKPIEDVNLP